MNLLNPNAAALYCEVVAPRSKVNVLILDLLLSGKTPQQISNNYAHLFDDMSKYYIKGRAKYVLRKLNQNASPSLNQKLWGVYDAIL